MQPNVPNTQPGNTDQNKCIGCGDPFHTAGDFSESKCNIY